MTEKIKLKSKLIMMLVLTFFILLNILVIGKGHEFQLPKTEAIYSMPMFP